MEQSENIQISLLYRDFANYLSKSPLNYIYIAMEDDTELTIVSVPKYYSDKGKYLVEAFPSPNIDIQDGYPRHYYYPECMCVETDAFIMAKKLKIISIQYKEVEYDNGA